MQKSNQKVLSLIVIFAILAGMLQFSSVTAYAATMAGTQFFYGGIKYQVLSDTNTVKVTYNIDENEFHNYNIWTSLYNGDIVIPETVSDGTNTYRVTEIGDQAFKGMIYSCSITLPNSITTIGAEAFSHSCMSSFTIPNSVTTIGSGAFDISDLRRIHIPENITSIGTAAFDDCDSLISITVDPDNKNYCSADGVLYNKDKTTLIQYPRNNPRIAYTIPDSVTKLDYAAMDWCNNLKTVTIGSNVSYFEDYAFYCDTTDLIFKGATPPAIVNLALYGFGGKLYVPYNTAAAYNAAAACTAAGIASAIEYSNVTYDLNGGTQTDSTPLSQSVSDTSSFTDPAVSKTGCFHVWSSSYSAITQNITYTAIWYDLPPSASLTSPSATEVSLSTSAIELTFNETVTKVKDKTITVSDGTNIYTYTINDSDGIVSGTGTNCKATIPFNLFKNGTKPLILSYGKTYTVSIEAGAFKDSSLNEVEAADIGSFVTQAAPSEKHHHHSSSSEDDKTADEIPDTDTSENGNLNPSGFSDTQNHWAGSSIEFVVSKGLFSGTGNGAFSPNSPMTRGMLVTVLGRLWELNNGKIDTSGGNHLFADVDSDDYFAGYASWAKQCGIAGGVSNDTFAPNGAVTREQLAVMLYNYAKYIGKDVSNIEGNMIHEFSDSEQISDWGDTAMRWALNTGLITGKSTEILDPKGIATRAEIAVIIERFTKI